VNRPAVLVLASALFAGNALFAQQLTSLITESKNSYNNVKNYLLKAAEKMPEDAYSFKPTPELQTFGQRVAHVAGQIGGCSALTGERKASDANSKTAKADLVAALKASFDACDAAWDSMNEHTAMEMVAGRGGAQRTKLAVLIGNTTHIDEVYGTMTVYMRLKGIVPPSSEGRGGMGR
jgi:DinB superfamily